MSKARQSLRDYEMMVILKPLLPDEVRKGIHKAIVGLIESVDGGTIIDTDVWGKRYLAYNIEGHNEGYYVVYTFKADASLINEMKRQLELKQEILRFMVMRHDKGIDVSKKIKKKEIEI